MDSAVHAYPPKVRRMRTLKEILGACRLNKRGELTGARLLPALLRERVLCVVRLKTQAGTRPLLGTVLFEQAAATERLDRILAEGKPLAHLGRYFGPETLVTETGERLLSLLETRKRVAPGLGLAALDHRGFTVALSRKASLADGQPPRLVHITCGQERLRYYFEAEITEVGARFRFVRHGRSTYLEKRRPTPTEAASEETASE